MTGILKDYNFTIAYLDDIIIFCKTPQEHLLHIRMVFEKFKSANLSMKRASAVSSPKKFSIYDTSSVLQVSAHYLPRHMPYNTCKHQLHPNKLSLSWISQIL